MDEIYLGCVMRTIFASEKHLLDLSCTPNIPYEYILVDTNVYLALLLLNEM